MLRGVAAKLENHHQVRIAADAVAAAVSLSHRYIPSRQLPDKAVSLLDTACSRVAMALHATPAQLEAVQRRIEALGVEQEVLLREAALGLPTAERLQALETDLAGLRERQATLAERFGQESALARRILETEAALMGLKPPVFSTGAAADPSAAAPETAAEATATEPAEPPSVASLEALRRQLAELQGDPRCCSPWSMPAWSPPSWPSGPAFPWAAWCVTRCSPCSRWQTRWRSASSASATAWRPSRAASRPPARGWTIRTNPLASSCSPAPRAWARRKPPSPGRSPVWRRAKPHHHQHERVPGGAHRLHPQGRAARLRGLRRRRRPHRGRAPPYSVVLLDEIEKAHSDVHEMFFQVFDKGWMEDGEGRYIDFKNTVIILTSNVGSDLIANMCRDPDLAPTPEGLAQAVRQPLLQTFPAALLGRLTVVPYYPISDAMLEQIIRLQMLRIQRRIEERHGAQFSFDEAAVELVRRRCSEVESGARMVDGILTQNLLPRMATHFLQATVQGQELQSLHAGASGDDFTLDVRTRAAEPA